MRKKHVWHVDQYNDNRHLLAVIIDDSDPIDRYVQLPNQSQHMMINKYKEEESYKE